MGWIRQAVLIARVERVRIFVRRIELDKNFCSSERSTRENDMQNSWVGHPIRGLKSRFCPTGWIGHRVFLFDCWNESSSHVRTRKFWSLFVGSSLVESFVRTQPDDRKILDIFFFVKEDFVMKISLKLELETGLRVQQFKSSKIQKTQKLTNFSL